VTVFPLTCLSGVVLLIAIDDVCHVYPLSGLAWFCLCLRLALLNDHGVCPLSGPLSDPSSSPLTGLVSCPENDLVVCPLSDPSCVLLKFHVCALENRFGISYMAQAMVPVCALLLLLLHLDLYASNLLIDSLVASRVTDFAIGDPTSLKAPFLAAQTHSWRSEKDFHLHLCSAEACRSFPLSAAGSTTFEH
jgi:hypothetical protein